jgi:hypothetical protein
MDKLGLDPTKDTPGRQVVRQIGESLVGAMKMAHENAPEREAAEIVACECIVLAETKDHLNWELIHEIADKAQGEQREALKAAYEQAEEEDEHRAPRPAGAGSCGSRRSGYRRCSRHRKKSEKSRPPSAQRARRWPENGCCSRAERARHDVLYGSAADDRSVALLCVRSCFAGPWLIQ